MHTVAARSIFSHQNSQKHFSFEALSEARKSKKHTPLWREAHFQVKSFFTVRTEHFLTFRCHFAWQAQGIAHLAKSDSKRGGCVAVSKTMAGAGHLNRICTDAFHLASALQETCSSEMLGGQGADFLRVGAFWSIRSSGLLK